jgi:type I restriction enzyme M protein
MRVDLWTDSSLSMEGNRRETKGVGSLFTMRWRAYDYEDLVNRDKASLDIFWLRDKSLEVSDNLPDPDVLAREIVEDLEAALEQFREIVNDLGKESLEPEKS